MKYTYAKIMMVLASIIKQRKSYNDSLKQNVIREIGKSQKIKIILYHENS